MMSPRLRTVGAVETVPVQPGWLMLLVDRSSGNTMYILLIVAGAFL